jgi:sulfite reductase (NADPH) flavoprotein alpha-component
MLRKILFQTHWFLGITAGLVLALVGVTGALLSYEDALLKALNPGVMTVEPAGRAPLPPAELLARVAAAEPGKGLQSLTLSSDARDAARVGFAPAPGAPPGPGGRPRGETRWLDPYTGALLGQPRGEGFFRFTMQLHRWLAAGEWGKQIVGASTVALVFFCASGLYLRWPRRWASLRAWLHLDTRLTGRRFLWHLHSVVATWLLVPYLVMALTGLWWSYGWYREGVNALAGMPAQAMRGGPGGAPGGRDAGPAPAVDVAAAYAAFDAAVPAWSTRTLRLPAAAGAPVEFSYQDAEPAHERANNRLALDAGTLAVAAHERFADKPAGQRFVAAIFPLHSGSFFGGPGLLLFCLASLAMPLFTVTGFQLYLDRRAKKRAGVERRRVRELALAKRSAG